MAPEMLPLQVINFFIDFTKTAGYDFLPHQYMLRTDVAKIVENVQTFPEYCSESSMKICLSSYSEIPE